MPRLALRRPRGVSNSPPVLSSASSTDVTCFTRAARNNSHNPPLSHPNRYPPRRLPLCSPLLRRTRRLAIRMVAVLVLLAVKVSRLSIHPFLLLTRPKTLLYPQKGVRMAPRPLVQEERALAGPSSSSGWMNTNGPASTAAIGKPSLGRDPKSRAHSREYLKQYALELDVLSSFSNTLAVQKPPARLPGPVRAPGLLDLSMLPESEPARVGLQTSARDG